MNCNCMQVTTTLASNSTAIMVQTYEPAYNGHGRLQQSQMKGDEPT